MSDNGNMRGFSYYGKTPSGVEMALTLDVDGSPQEIADYLRRVDHELKIAGFTRSDRLDKPAYGGGGGRPGAPRPEEKPPADLVVPEHCGQPMVYRPPKEATADKKAVAARWECRKGRDCVEAEERGGNKYPATNWHMNKKPTGERAPLAERVNGSEKPLGYGEFLNVALAELKMTRAQILAYAHTNEDELKKLGSAGWLDLLAKMREKVEA